MCPEQETGKFDQLADKIKEKWGRLTDADAALYTNGRQDQFFGKLKEAYGIAKEDAERQIRDLERHVGDRAA